MTFAVSVPADTISSIVKIVKGLDNELIKIYKEDAHLYLNIGNYYNYKINWVKIP